MSLSTNTKEVLHKVVSRWLRKGKMSRQLRNTLPYSGLGHDERAEIAYLGREIVRWRRWYDRVLEHTGMARTADSYIALAGKELVVDREEVEAGIPEDEKLAVRYSFSDFAAKTIKEIDRELASYLNREPEKYLCVNLNKASRSQIIKNLLEEGFTARKGELNTCVVTDDNARYSKVIKNGLAHVQDQASQFVAQVAADLGDNIMDYCAGSGGKTLAIASIRKNKGILAAHDKNEKKLRALTERAEKHEAEVEILDRPKEEYDMVLADAPCSGLGAARRNPEAKYVVDADDFPVVQLDILKKAGRHVAAGGHLVYSVCTFTSQETKGVVDKFLNDGKFKPVEASHFGLSHTRLTYPEVKGGDIFYLAVLKKAARA